MVEHKSYPKCSVRPVPRPRQRHAHNDVDILTPIHSVDSMCATTMVHSKLRALGHWGLGDGRFRLPRSLHKGQPTVRRGH